MAEDLKNDEEVPEAPLDDFVYDIYYADNKTNEHYADDANVAGLIWEDSPDFNELSDEDQGEEDEDSNCEEYWKNDYPEEEEYANEIQGFFFKLY